MSNVAIRVAELGKRYRIGKRERYRTLRDSVTDIATSPFRRIRSLLSRQASLSEAPDLFWALKGVSFEVPYGAVIGIIGRNGAGKSTLLKILSRITEPTEGRVEIHGRVGSLLEVGTGFHPELTGRENVYLNGAILGMRKSEVDGKFDEIVDFAEVEQFIDTPVKHFSSGMYMRLAFAVAAHLDPEILVVDEVLAVGDTKFQKKCLGRLGEFAESGRTVLFVSHNMVAVERLCSHAILLDSGRLAVEGAAAMVVREYLKSVDGGKGCTDLSSARRAKGTGEIRFTSIEVAAAETKAGPRAGEPMRIRLGFRCRRPVASPVFSISIWTTSGACLFAIHTSDSDFHISGCAADGGVELTIHNPNLLPGRYLVHCAVGTEHDPHQFDHVIDAAVLDVAAADVYQTGRLPGIGWSNLFFNCRWRVVSTSADQDAAQTLTGVV